MLDMWVVWTSPPLQVVHLLMFNMREGILCVWGWLMCVGVVDVYDTNMGFKPPCHFVIVHMKPSYVVVILKAYLMDLHFHFVESLGFVSMI